MFCECSHTLLSPCKLFASDLKLCKRIDNKWCIPLECKQHKNSMKLTFNDVWLQGCVSSISKNDQLVLNDGTGEVLVRSFSSTEGDKSWLVEGALCMVLGQLQVATPTASVIPCKVSQVALAEKLANECWAAEVTEAKLVIANPPLQITD